MAKNANKSESYLPLTAASDEAWEEGLLGRSEAHVKVSDPASALDLERELNEALELQPISIRLNKSLIEDLKMIAELAGLGYQPLIRQVLTRFTDCEKKRLLRQIYSEEIKKQGDKKSKKMA